MILNHSKTIRSVCPYYVQDTIMEMHSRDITHLILCTTPACFSYFNQCAMVPTLVENSKFFSVLVTTWQ